MEMKMNPEPSLDDVVAGHRLAHDQLAELRASSSLKHGQELARIIYKQRQEIAELRKVAQRYYWLHDQLKSRAPDAQSS
jgi:hypothetical protein